MSNCFHCGLPASPEFSKKINGITQSFCCPGCQAVTLAIYENGLGNYYEFRDSTAAKASEQEQSFAAYDLEEIQHEFVTTEENLSTAKLSVGGISCAACAWLIENRLENLDGVDSIRVNATSRQAVIRWDKNKTRLSQIFSALSAIGYTPSPAQHQDSQVQRQKEFRQALLRLGVAGIAMMQVGMVAVALYAGGEQGISSYWQWVLRWVSLIVATPVILFSAQPFFKSAWRSLRSAHLNMDVPVSLALLLAYLASFWATLHNTGEVYFDSVSMFTFFLLLGRFLELRARHSSAFATENLMQLLPLMVTKIVGETMEEMPLSGIKVGDKLWVGAGAVIPVDGKLLAAHASVDESLITGESEFQNKKQGDVLVAGTHNGDTGLAMEVTAVGKNTQLAAIEKLVVQAELDKPRQVSLADKIAGRFVGAVLFVALIVAGIWWAIDPERVIWVLLSILVVTCPCALSLATPAALTAGTNRCRKLGLMVLSGHVIETLTKVSEVIFDKTGTLTFGSLVISDTVSVREQQKLNAMDVICALERHSRHPIAKAFENYNATQYLRADNVVVYGGFGIEGNVQGSCYRFGKPEFCREIVEKSADFTWSYPGDGLWQILVDEQGPLAWIKLQDELRPSAAAAIQALLKQNKEIALLSGDRQENVDLIANTLHIETRTANATPQSKLTWLKAKQQRGGVTLMVGDGINDVPVLSAADVAVAMGSATQLAQTRADAVLLSGDLSVLPKSLLLAKRVQGIIRQNIAWAIGYNLIALPAAASGLVPPWLAAIGMSLSSLIVVLNAMRT